MKSLSSPGLYVVALLCIGSTSLLAEDVWLTDLNQARDLAQKTNRPILCHFYAEWCGPCQQMEHKVFKSQQVQQLLQSSVIPVKIDTQTQGHLSKRFNVTSLPTDLILEPNGKEILQSSGYRSVTEYSGLVMRARTRYEDLVASRTPAKPATPAETNEKIRPAATPEVMLAGFCPVTLWKSRRWEKGSIQFQAEHKGQRYLFASSEALQEFNQNAERYCPQFLGCDPIVVWETDRAVSGDIRFGAFYDERLYLFTTDENRRRFKSSPDRFIKTQVVLHVEQIERVLR